MWRGIRIDSAYDDAKPQEPVSVRGLYLQSGYIAHRQDYIGTQAKASGVERKTRGVGGGLAETAERSVGSVS
jgi:hypothetical protein